MLGGKKGEKVRQSYSAANSRILISYMINSILFQATRRRPPMQNGSKFSIHLFSIFMEISKNRHLLPFRIVLEVFKDMIFECQCTFCIVRSNMQ